MLKRKIIEVYQNQHHSNLSPIRFQRKSSNASPGKSPIRCRTPIRNTSPFKPTSDYRSTSPIKFVKNQCIKKISNVLAIQKQQNGYHYNRQQQQISYKKIQAHFNPQQQHNKMINIQKYQKFSTNSDRFIPQQKGKLFSKLVQKLNSDKKQPCHIVSKKRQTDIHSFDINIEQQKLRSNKQISRFQNKDQNNTIQNVQIIQSTIYEVQKNDLQKVKYNNLNQRQNQRCNQKQVKNEEQKQTKNLNQKQNNDSYISPNNTNNNYINGNSVKNIRNKIVKKQSESDNCHRIEDVYFKNTQIKIKTLEKSQNFNFEDQQSDINLYLMKMKESYKTAYYDQTNTKHGNISWTNAPVQMSLNMDPFM